MSTTSTSSNPHSFSRQASQQEGAASQAPGLFDSLSRFSVEDLPIVGVPSPQPGRAIFPGPNEAFTATGNDSDEEYEEEKVRV